MTQAIRDAITRAADENGVDRDFALAVAERESGFDPNAKSSKTIRGIYQMTHGLRQKYGIGDSVDPYEQASGWARFIKDQNSDFERRTGRPPTPAESYMVHHFGIGRASRMASGAVHPDTSVADVFTPQELAGNPHIGRAGTVGALTSSITGDIDRRRGKFGGSGTGSGPGASQQEAPDFSHLGTLAEQQPEQSWYRSSEAPDFSHMGTLAQQSQAPDFSHLGTLAEQQGAPA